MRQKKSVGLRQSHQKSESSASVINNARAVASRVMYRVESQQAWLAPTLNAEIQKANLDTRDAGLATAIAYGSVRFLHPIDRILQKYLKKPIEDLEPWVKSVMRVSVFQMHWMDKQPNYAIVHEAVNLVQGQRGKVLGKLTNAILRKVSQVQKETIDSTQKIPIAPWIWESMKQSLGEENSHAFLSSRPLPPPIGIRISHLQKDKEALINAWKEKNARIEVSQGLEGSGAVLVKNSGNPRRLEGYEEGLFSIQEEGAQIVGNLAEIKPTEKILDVCAGRGGKTCQLAAGLQGGGHIDAVDLYESKLDAIHPELERLKIAKEKVSTFALDMTVGVGNLTPEYDHIFVDAPCTGLGTFHRRPEILLRVEQTDIQKMAQLQLQILARSSTLLKVGGHLTYAVCSFTEEEGEKVAQTFEQNHPQYERVLSLPSGLGPWESQLDPALIQLGPWLSKHHESPDVYQVARWKRVQ